MAKREPKPPFFVISMTDNAIVRTTWHDDLKTAHEFAQSGAGVTNFVASTEETYDRCNLNPAEIAGECAKLMMEITSNRHTSSPQCIPIAMYKQMAKLAKQYQAAIITAEQK